MANADLFESALAAEGVTGMLANLARSVYMQESGGGRNTKTSNAGAVGGMQIVPTTFRSVADKDWDINDPLHNARAGIRYLKELNQKAGGDLLMTAAGYYGGPGAMAKAKQGVGVIDPRNPTAPNTLQYAQQVVGRLPKGAPSEAAPVAVAQAVPQVVPEFRQLPANPNVPDAGQAPAAAPVQVAEAPVPQAVPEWQQFQQATPDPLVAALQYQNQPTPNTDYRQYLTAPKINFAAFGGLGRRGRG